MSVIDNPVDYEYLLMNYSVICHACFGKGSLVLMESIS